MFDNIVTAVGSLFRSALAVLAGTTAAVGRWDIPPAQGSIIEIEPGIGPSWGTLSGLTAPSHGPDPALCGNRPEFTAHSHRRNRT